MPSNPGNLHIDVFLTGVAGGYSNTDFIADQIAPIVPSPKETGKVAQYGVEHYRLDFNARAMGVDTPRGDWQANTPVTFAAQDWEFEIPVDDRQLAYYDDPFDANVDATNTVMQKITAKREDIVATALINTSGNFGGTAAVGTKWVTSKTTADPFADIRAAMESIRSKTGIGYGNMIGYCSAAVWNALINTTLVRQFYINTTSGAATPASLLPKMIATGIGLADIFVGPAVKLTSKEGDTGDPAMTDIWGTSSTNGNFAIICRSPKPSFMAPGFAVVISPTVPGLKGQYVSVDRYREERKRSTIVRAAALFDCIAVTKNLGYLLTACNA